MTVVAARKALTLAAIAAGASALALAPSALGLTVGSPSVKLSNGSTKLWVSPPAARLLADAGVGISPIPPASSPARTQFGFPIAPGGGINPRSGVGVYRHRGGLAIRSADSSRTLRLRRFVADTRTRTLSGQVGSTNARVAFGRIGLANSKVLRRGPGGVSTWIVRATLRITPTGAAAIDQFFGRDLGLAGLELGRIDIRSTPAEVIIDGGTTTLMPPASADGSLARPGGLAKAIPPARLNEKGALQLPILGGGWLLVPQRALPQGGGSALFHSGGLSLAGPGGSPRIELGGAPTGDPTRDGFQLYEFTPRNGDLIAAAASPDLPAGGSAGDPVFDLALDFSQAKTGLSGGMLVINNAVGNLPNPVFDTEDDDKADQLVRDLLDVPIGPEPVDEDSPKVDVSGDGATLRIKAQVR